MSLPVNGPEAHPLPLEGLAPGGCPASITEAREGPGRSLYPTQLVLISSSSARRRALPSLLVLALVSVGCSAKGTSGDSAAAGGRRAARDTGTTGRVAGAVGAS